MTNAVKHRMFPVGYDQSHNIHNSFVLQLKKKCCTFLVDFSTDKITFEVLDPKLSESKPRRSQL